MPNMKYCMFENTYNDLQDCYNALNEYSVKHLEENANKYEKKYIRKLIDLCEEIASNYGLQDDEDWEEEDWSDE